MGVLWEFERSLDGIAIDAIRNFTCTALPAVLCTNICGCPLDGTSLAKELCDVMCAVCNVHS